MNKINVNEKKLKSKRSLIIRIIIGFILVIVYFILTYYLEKPVINDLNDLNHFVLQEVLRAIRSAMPLAAVLTIFIVPVIKKMFSKYNEDKKKEQSDKHIIIEEYITKDEIDKKFEPIKGKNIYDENGYPMQIKKLDNDNRYLIIQRHKSKYEDKELYDKEQASINSYKSGSHLTIAERNIFTNLTGKIKLIVSNDTRKYHPLDRFIEDNRMILLGAHDTKNNNTTIRLDDYKCKKPFNCLSFNISRTTYFDMLTTNRALDYPLGETTLRGYYEYKDVLTKLSESKLSNQIGIVGIVITNDGYILTEVRGYNKSIWKNMYGPPISLSLKENALFKDKNSKIKGNNHIFENKILDRIEKTLKSNFNLIQGDDYNKLIFEKNFMGFSRDILEGGKPNLYFFVQLKDNAEEAVKKMQKYATITEEEIRSPLKSDKINNNYYFINYKNFNIDYNYKLHCNPETKKIRRKYRKNAIENKEYEYVNVIGDTDTREVAEGMLACMAYLELILDYGNNTTKTNQNRIVGDNWWE